MITYENALKLKESGFPQPGKALDQKWFDSKGVPWIIGKILRTDEQLVARCLVNTTWEWLHDTNGFVYAPTALDILAQMGGYMADGANIYRVRGGIVESTVYSDLDLDNAAVLCYMEDTPDPLEETEDYLIFNGDGSFYVNGVKLNQNHKAEFLKEHGIPDFTPRGYGDSAGGNLSSFLGSTRPGVKYLTGKVNCPDNGTVDGVELECGDMHLWKSAHSDVENGIYTIGVDPALFGASETTAFIQHPDGLIEKISPKGFAGTYTPLHEECKMCRNCNHWAAYEIGFAPITVGACMNSKTTKTDTIAVDSCDKWEEILP